MVYYECPYCGRKYPSKRVLMEHISKHHPGGQLAAEEVKPVSAEEAGRLEAQPSTALGVIVAVVPLPALSRVVCSVLRCLEDGRAGCHRVQRCSSTSSRADGNGRGGEH